MFNREMRLGDAIDDYCVRCKLVMDHSIVALVDGEVKKVRCGTCSFEHPFRHGEGARKKRGDVQSLFDQVAATMPGYSQPSPDALKSVKKSPPRKK